MHVYFPLGYDTKPNTKLHDRNIEKILRYGVIYVLPISD